MTTITPTLTCSNCGGANTYDGHSEAVHCQYCGTLLPLPEPVKATRQSRVLAAQGGLAARYLLIAVLFTIAVPTCLGLAGAAIGLLAPILGILLQLILG